MWSTIPLCPARRIISVVGVENRRRSSSNRKPSKPRRTCDCTMSAPILTACTNGLSRPPPTTTTIIIIIIGIITYNCKYMCGCLSKVVSFFMVISGFLCSSKTDNTLPV
uniref:DNA-directed RNA polymerase II subunit RPB9 n=1 Tax=Schistocephalus solidus TaxID=70667 RepID=A0A0X3NY61_SCHSO